MNLRTRILAFSFAAATLFFASCQKTEIDPIGPAAKSNQRIQQPEVVQDGEEAEKPPIVIIIR